MRAGSLEELIVYAKYEEVERMLTILIRYLRRSVGTIAVSKFPAGSLFSSGIGYSRSDS